MKARNFPAGALRVWQRDCEAERRENPPQRAAPARRRARRREREKRHRGAREEEGLPEEVTLTLRVEAPEEQLLAGRVVVVPQARGPRITDTALSGTWRSS